MRRLARLIALPGLLVALAAGAIVVSVVGLPDDPPPADADLIVEFLEVPHELNGYVALQEALDRGEDFPSAARAALEMPFFARRRLELWESSPAWALSWSMVQESFECHIRQAEREGDHRGAFQGAMLAVEAGRRLEMDEGDYFGCLFGIVLKQHGYDAIRGALRRLPAQDLVAGAAVLLKSEALKERRLRVYRTEYTMAVRLVDAVARGEVASDRLGRWRSPGSVEGVLENATLLLDREEVRKMPNRTKRRLAASTRRAIEQAGLTEAERARRGARAQHGISLFWLPGESENAVRSFATDALDAAATSVLLALRAYQLENGGLPDSLWDLVPRYLECVPADPYDGEPLRYSPAKKVVYSVGEDFIDEGGAEKDERGRWRPHPALEPTFAIEF